MSIFKKKLKFTKQKLLVINFADHMRVIFFYIYLSFLLLCGRNYLYANTHHSPASCNRDLEKKQQVKHRNSNHHSIAIADADIDLDEEFHDTDEFKVGGSDKFSHQKHSFLDSWDSKSSHQFNLNFYSKSFKIFAPFSIHSNPIYIRMGVLRI